MATFFQSRRTLCLAAILVGYSCFAPEGLADPVRLAQFFDGHCVACHGVNGEAGVDLTSQAIGADLSQQPELIQRVLTAVDTGFMPPQEEESLDLKLRQEAVNQLRILRNEAVQARPQFRRTPIRRMNRLQYNNAVQDLFGLTVEVFPLRERMMRDLSRYFQPQTGAMPDEVKVASRPLGKFQIIERHLSLATPFPQDLRAENGFDTQADHLTLSPVLMDSFLRLSRAVVDSSEFNRRNVGVWEQFFEAPPETQPDSGASPRTLLENRLRPFLTRAFRRTADDAQVQRYVDSVMRQLKDGAEFTEAMKDVAAAVIASPQFLYLHDQDRLPPLAAAPRFEETATNSNRQPEVPRLDDFSLASRLSFFLWGSLPDDELLQLAAARRLQDPVVLSGQVDRMLQDTRLRRFCDSFPSQWLQLERIISTEPDPEQFPQFYFAKYRVSMHMMLEPLLVFETILIENRPVTELIDSDFSYRSDLLQAWYRDGSQENVGPPTQVVLKRVPVTDRRQGGVMTTAAVMAMTSGPRRTKPITRGAWLATVILNSPPPPPPGNVPPLADKPAADEEQLTLRERFAIHRDHVACAGCHQRIDPLGFALENYDAAGIWRDQYDNGRSVDSAGRLFGRYEFTDIIGFKDALLAEKERFVGAFAAHLLCYATGRPVTVEDAPVLDEIVRQSATDEYRMQSLIRNIVLSRSFQR